jgi:hypothetical protein
MNRDRRARQLASLLAIFVAGLATIATSVPSGVVFFGSAGHVWVANDQPGSVAVHVEVNTSHIDELEGIDIRLTQGFSDAETPLVASLAASIGHVSGDWRALPTDWHAVDLECVAWEPCIRDYRIDIRSTDDLTIPVLVRWGVNASLYKVQSYDLVDLTIGPVTPTPAPGALGILSASAAAALTMLLVAVASWRTKRPERVLTVVEIAVVIFMAVIGAGLLIARFPASAGGGFLLLIAAAAVLVTARLRGAMTDSPRVVVLLISLPATALLITAYQIAESVIPLEILLPHIGIGAAVGVAVAGFVRPSWWRWHLTGSRDWFVALITVSLALMLAGSALVAAATSGYRDPLPPLVMALAVLVLLALREWAKKPTFALRIVGMLIVGLSFATAFAKERFGNGLFDSVPRPPGPAGPLVFTLTLGMVAAGVAFLARSRDSQRPMRTHLTEAKRLLEG